MGREQAADQERVEARDRRVRPVHASQRRDLAAREAERDLLWELHVACEVEAASRNLDALEPTR